MDLSCYWIIDEKLEKYEKAGYTRAQIKELRRGIESDLDISLYDDKNNTPEEMFNKRWELMHIKYSKLENSKEVS